MTTQLQEKPATVYHSQFEAFQLNGGKAAPEWLRELRRQAFSRFSERGLPTRREEEWRFTTIGPLTRLEPRPAMEPAPDGLSPEQIEPLTFGIPARLVFVNGRYAKTLSTPEALPKGVRFLPLAEAVREHPETVRKHLGRIADEYTNPFTALNTAFLNDGAYIETPKGAVAEEPVLILHLSIPGEEPTVSHPRLLVVAGENSRLSLVEAYGSGRHDPVRNRTRRPEEGGVNRPAATVSEPSPYFTNGVTEIAAGENAVIDHYKVQVEGAGAYHVGTAQFRQERNSQVTSHSIALGGKLARSDLRFLLAGEGAGCVLNGLYRVSGKQEIDHHTVVDHAVPHCTSRELYKGVLDEKGHAVFNGKVIVRPGAQKTSAEQENKNLLLSDEALVDTQPALEIYADDVKCAHGATVGQLEEEPLFYLRSRGIPFEEARAILTRAFAADVLDRIQIPSLRKWIDERTK